MIIRRTGKFDDYGHMLRYRSATAANLVDLNYWGNGSDGSLVINSDTTWDSGSAGDMLVKNLIDFTVNAGVTLMIKARKGCLIYVKGNCSVNGTIRVVSGYSADPVTEGVNASGLKIARFVSGFYESGSSDLSGCGNTAISAENNQSVISGDGKIWVIQRTGSDGGAGHTGDGGSGNDGGNGTGSDGKSGGGASGAAYPTNLNVYSADGGDGTCWSGGVGSGGTRDQTSAPDAVSDIGREGGDGLNNGSYSCGGGAGNPGGSNVGALADLDPEDVCGGTLIMCCRGNLNVGTSGSINANGGKGGGTANATAYTQGGGGSGAGNILILYGGSLDNDGSITATGGDPGPGNDSSHDGGKGGAGSIQGPSKIER